MRSLVCRSFGGPESTGLHDVPPPTPGEGELLVEVHAAGVNPHDVNQRNGHLRRIEKVNPPIALGSDVSGVVVAKGPSTGAFDVGDEVFAMTAPGRGTIAELVVVRTDEAAVKPPNLAHAEAAAVPLVGIAALAGLDALAARSGSRLYVVGGAGGVGHLAVQLAKRAGAWVAASASGPRGDVARRLGADLVVDHRKVAPESEVRGVDGALDTAGGDALMSALATLRRKGALVTTVGPRAIEDVVAWRGPTLGLATMGLDLARMRALAWRRRRARYVQLATRPNGAALARLSPALEDRSVIPLVDRVVPFDRAPEALAAVESGGVAGKVVVKVR